MNDPTGPASRATPPAPREPLRRIDWGVVAPWLLLLRAPEATLGRPLLVAAAATLLVGLPPVAVPWALPGPDDPPQGIALARRFALDALAGSVVASDLLGAVGMAAVWSLAGLLIARVAAPSLARTGRGPSWSGLSASLPRAAARVATAAAIGAAVIGTLVVANWIGGSLVRGLPEGPPQEVATPVALLLLGLPLAAALLVAAVGWPLAVVAVAIDGADGFDALSRAVAYSTQRLARLAGYAVVAVAVGWFAALGVEALLGLATAVTAGAIGPGLTYSADSLLRRAGLGFYPAYCWVAATAVYLLLRQDVDGQPTDDLPADVGQASDRA